MTTTQRVTAMLTATLILWSAACGPALKEPSPPIGQPLLPDLMPAPPVDLQMTHEGARWSIRFSSILVNVGQGDFIVRAVRRAGVWHVEQDVPYSTSGAEKVPIDATLAWGGDGHEHWHVESVATARLASLDGKTSTTHDLDRTDSKIGFCIFDYGRHLEKGPATAVYSRESCGHLNDTAVGMGLSPGWNDTYTFDLPGQSIDVSDLRDGPYRLWSEVDERGRFREASRDNNVTWVDFELSTRADGLRFAKIVKVGPAP